MPARTLSSVVLPLPLAPTNPTRSCAVIIQLRSSKSSLGPKRLPAPESWIIYVLVSPFFRSIARVRSPLLAVSCWRTARGGWRALRFAKSTQGVADDDVHPAEERDREVIAFG